ncbi:MAG: hypothetical protein ABH878_04435, partial [bacterium]
VALAQRAYTKMFFTSQQYEHTACPSVFTLRPLGKGGGYVFNQNWELELYCEEPGCWHPTGKTGTYPITQPSLLVQEVGEQIRKLAKMLKYVSFVGYSWFSGAEAELKHTQKRHDLAVEFMSKIWAEEIANQRGDFDLRREQHMLKIEGADLHALRKFLEELDFKHTWGGLKRIFTPEGHYLWLCDRHAEFYRI